MMMYDLFQGIVIALLVSYSAVKLARTLMPHTMRRLLQHAAIPAWMRAKAMAMDTQNQAMKSDGCSDCASCKRCSSIAANLAVPQ